MTTIEPWLSVRRGASAIEFYKTAFGAEVVYLIDNDKGVVARFSIAGAQFWISDESPEHGNFSPETLGGGTIKMLLIVDDPDTTFDRAVAAGATVVARISDSHGWRTGRVADPFGHHWEIGKQLR